MHGALKVGGRGRRRLHCTRSFPLDRGQVHSRITRKRQKHIGYTFAGMLLLFHHFWAVAQEEEQGLQVGCPADPGAVWAGGGGVDADCAAAADPAAVRGAPWISIRKDGVADELGDEPAHDMSAHHPWQAGLEHLDAVVARKGAAAVGGAGGGGAAAAAAAAVAAVSSCPCSEHKRGDTNNMALATPESRHLHAPFRK